MRRGEDAMVPLNLPVADLRITQNSAGRIMVYDRWRRRDVALTPEEWVRQHFVAMMVSEKGYLSGRIANEMSISLNGMSRRCDTVVFDDNCHPLMIVEYKAPSVAITQDVFDQIAHYAMVLRPRFIAVSNGLSHYCCRIDYNNGSYRFMPEFPDYQSIV